MASDERQLVTMQSTSEPTTGQHSLLTRESSSAISKLEHSSSVFKESHHFGFDVHNPSDSDSTEQHIFAAGQRAANLTIQHEASIYQSWVASGSALSIEQWVRAQKELENDLKVKQEEMELDPLADMPKISFTGMGNKVDPINLTLND